MNHSIAFSLGPTFLVISAVWNTGGRHTPFGNLRCPATANCLPLEPGVQAHGRGTRALDISTGDGQVLAWAWCCSRQHVRMGQTSPAGKHCYPASTLEEK